MKAIHVSSFGGPNVLSVTEMETLIPDDQQVVIDIKAAGVGFVDVMFRKGSYPGLSTPGFIPGLEVSGIVTAVGADVDEQWLNKRVFAIIPGGGYAEQVAVSANSLIAIPDALSFDQVIGVGVNALVAYFSLKQAKLGAGDNVLVRGAGGGIGSLIVQMALSIGLNVTAQSSSTVKSEKLKQMGAIPSSNVTDLNTETFNAIFDPVAGLGLDPFVNLLRKNGRYLLIGAAGGFPEPGFGMSWLSRFQMSLSFHAVSLSSINESEIKEAMHILFDMALHEKIAPIIDRTFKLEEAEKAHEYLESGAAFGKIILVR